MLITASPLTGLPGAGRVAGCGVRYRIPAYWFAGCGSSCGLRSSIPHPRLLVCRVRVELRVAEFDLAAAVQEGAEDDADGIGRDLGGDLVAGPVTGSRDGGEVVLGIVPGIRWGRSPSFAGDAEHQSGAVGDAGGAQVAAEGDGAAAVVVGFDLLAEDGESGGSGHGRGQDRPPVFGGAGIVLVVGPGHLAQEGAIELPSVQAVGERQVARLEPRVLGRP